MPASSGRSWFGVAVDALAVAAGLGAVVVFARMLIVAPVDHVPEVDSHGYFLMARELAAGRMPQWDDDIARFRGHVWVDVGGGKVMAKYPPGWPLLLAVGYRVNGLDGALSVNIVLGIVGAAAFYGLAWQLLGTVAAAVCTWIWLFSPILLFYVGYPLSHSADITFVLLSFVLCIAWARTRWTALAAAGGFCAGFLVLIRPMSILVWPALIAAMVVMRSRASEPPQQPALEWLAMRRRPWALLARVPRGVWAMIIGAAMPLTFLAIYNTWGFGAPWRTGYWLTAEQGAFDFSDWPKRLDVVFAARRILLEDRYWLLVLAGLVLAWRSRRLLWVLVPWLVPLVTLYTAYYFFSPYPHFLRFYLTALPAAVLCAGLLIGREVLRSAVARAAVLAAAAAWLALQPPIGLTEASTESAASLAAFSAHHPAQRAMEEARGSPTTVLAYETVFWTVASDERGVAYDLSAWTDTHLAAPPSKACRRTEVRQDMARHLRLHEVHRTMGQGALKADLLLRIERELSAGRRVLIASPPGDPARRWIEADPRWTLRTLGECDGRQIVQVLGRT